MPTDNETSKIWERQKGESTANYQLFHEFLKIGPKRSIPQLIEKVTESDQFNNTPSRSTLNNRSSDWDWFNRATAYDDYIREKERIELEELAYERRKKRLEQNALEEDLIHLEIMDVLKIKDKGFKPSQKAYSVKFFSDAKRNASESQRLDFGEPTTIEESKTEIKGEIKTNDKLLKDPDYIASRRREMDEYYAKHRGKRPD